jgi:hypothetical protein
MTYTSENAKENKQMLSLAKELLGAKNAQNNNIYAKIAERFPGVTQRRINYWLDKAKRELRCEEIRRRGGQAGNQNAAKAEKSSMWSGRLSREAKRLACERARAQGISQGRYIERLILQDNPDPDKNQGEMK